MQMAEATIRDVARHAEISVASVSRALNGLTNVHPDTKARVLASAKKLGYVPHAGARSLSMARTHAIGVVLPDLHGEFFSEIVRGIDREASGRGYQLLLSNMHADVELASLAMRSMRGRVDGLIVMAPQIDPAELAETLPGGFPVVLVNSPDGSGRHSMRIDNRTAADVMVRHLLDSGRKALVHISGPADNMDARERIEGFSAALAKYAPSLPAKIIKGNFSEEAGELAVKKLIADGTPFDAIFAANDMMALGALLALKEAGIDVPGTVAVAGFDDVPLARYLALTTMRIHLAELGARAVSRLIDELDGEAAASTTELLTADLVVRASTGQTSAH